MSLRTTATHLTALVALLAMLAVGCASDEAEPPAEEAGEQQPGVAGTPVGAALADVPVPTGAEVVSEVTEQDGVQTVSYEVTATSPRQVLDFYAEQLPDLGWQQREVEELGPDFRAFYEMAEAELLIAVSPTDEDDTALNLQLTEA